MKLSDIFPEIAIKRLSNVDINLAISNQHEINGVTALRELFGTAEKTTGNIDWFYFPDSSDKVIYSGIFTFYDARAASYQKTGRSEWRLYYSGDIFSNCKIGDLLIILKKPSGSFQGLILPQDSRLVELFINIFKIDPEKLINSFITVEPKILVSDLSVVDIQFLEELDINVLIPEDKFYSNLAEVELDNVAEDSSIFPSTARMAEITYHHVGQNFTDPDDFLIKLIEFETQLFYAIEKILLDKKLSTHFKSTEEFISYSLSVQNRRKSRMGYSLQNHLANVFTKSGLLFQTQKMTEGKNKPDFIFPGIDEYHDANYPVQMLTMLAAKSTCKDRWRQILTEANRIEHKHLCTLDQLLTLEQVNEMKTHHVFLVIPNKIALKYGPNSKSSFLSLASFVDIVRQRQKE